MTITCPNCGSPVAPGERFCGECGTDVTAARQQAASDAGRTTPMPSEPPVANQQPTYNQQAQYNQQAPFNPQTNYNPPVTNQQAPYNPAAYQQYNTAPRRSNPALMWVGIGLLVAGLLFGVIIYAAVAGSTGSTDLSGQSSAYQAGYGLGQCLCGFGVFLLLGVPGIILLIMGRRK